MEGGENLGEENEVTKSTQFLIGNITNRTERGIAAFGIGAGRGPKEKEDPADPKKKKKDSPSGTPNGDDPVT